MCPVFEGIFCSWTFAAVQHAAVERYATTDTIVLSRYAVQAAIIIPYVTAVVP